MNMYKKRERTQNWAHHEKRYLLELCRKDMRIIENKRLDAGLTALKNRAWKIIHQRFSAQFGNDRTCTRLKEQWRRMKALTRTEIMDYNNRVLRYGPAVADQKRPSPFVFEIWDFMQEAKRMCKNEALDEVDYSKVPLALDSDGADGDYSESERTSCVEIKKEETSSDRDVETDRMSDNSFDQDGGSSLHTTSIADPLYANPAFTVSNMASTLETISALRKQQAQQEQGHSISRGKGSSGANDEDEFKTQIRALMEMQAKEHVMRIQILEMQFETAKFNRDIVEINKTLALQDLHEMANRRMKRPSPN